MSLSYSAFDAGWGARHEENYDTDCCCEHGRRKFRWFGRCRVGLSKRRNPGHLFPAYAL